MKHSKNTTPEQHLLYLFVALFFISLVKSIELLGVLAVVIIIYSLSSHNNIFKLLLPVAPFIILLILPSVLNAILGRGLALPEFTILIIVKVAISAILLGTFVAKYSSLHLIDGILGLGLPPLLARIIALTFRYFYMISRDVSIGRAALISRGMTNNNNLANITKWGEWMGGFFLKSSIHAENVHNAMSARGFTGDTGTTFFRRKDLVVRLVVLSILVAVVLYLESRFLTWGLR